MTPLTAISNLYARTHADILNTAAQLTDEELHRTFGLHAPSVAFHAWHVARWADYVYETIHRTLMPGSASTQVWDEYQLAEEWGLTGIDHGHYGTGMEMSDEDAVRLKLPERGELLDYVSMSFASVDKLVESLKEHDLTTKTHTRPGRETTIEEFLGIWA